MSGRVQENIQKILDTEVSRKEFLTLVALGLGSVMGLSSIIKFLRGGKSGHGLLRGQGYGASAYGGGKDHLK